VRSIERARWRGSSGAFTAGKGKTLAHVFDLAKRNGCDVSELAKKHRGRKSNPRGNPRGTPRAPGEIELTEDGVARNFTERHRNRLRFDHDMGKWFEWTGDHWAADGRARAFNYCREAAHRASVDASAKELSTARRASFASGVERMAKADPAHAVTQEVWDPDPWLIGVPGGVVDLKNGRMRPAAPEDMVTKRCAVAPAPTQDCPRWLQFLEEATGEDLDLIRFLQQWAGYSLTGITREHALVFMYGGGGNGKSVFLNTVAGMLGDYATQASMDTFTASKHDRHPTDLAALRGARMVTASETEEGRAWAEARIKALTGGDKISARFMRQDFFEFTPQFKLIIAGNHRPTLRNIDPAMQRRLNIVPFTRKPATPDQELETKLRAEWPGILRWAIDGALDWQLNGLIRPSSVTAATAAYFEENDLFGTFLEEMCETDPGNDRWFEPAPGFFKRWQEYAIAAGDEPGNARWLGENMARRGFAKMKRRCNGTTPQCFIGVRLKDFGTATDFA
jgi:phage/plasmid primase, P4 family, C-terminal domain